MESIILRVLREHGNVSNRKQLRALCKSEAADLDVGKVNFKKSLAALQEADKVTIDDGNIVSLVISSADNAEGTESSKKRKRSSGSDVEVRPKSKQSEKKNEKYKELWRTGDQLWRENGFDQDYLRENPDGITRLFCGNLNRTVTADQLKTFIEGITHIKWITDKETKQFYGSTFIECKDVRAASNAVMKDKQKFLGRPIKIYYCPPRPGDVWPPQETALSRVKDPPVRQKTPKPYDNCCKLFAGNLSYNIDDDSVVDFFKDCGTLVGLRWLTHAGSGEFRGQGYVEFETTEQAEKAIKLDGKELLGRPIRLDWTE